MVKPFQPPVLTDEFIAELLEEAKPVPTDWQTRLVPRTMRLGHGRASLEIVGAKGNQFSAMARQNARYADNFSVILGYRSTDGHSYRLMRCNGLHPGGHRNTVEGTSFGTAFHVHRASARYQERGLNVDGYAEITTGYSSLAQAIRELGRMTNFEPEGGQQEMDI